MSAKQADPGPARSIGPGDGHATLEAERLLHELQVHQVELLQQNEELRQARLDIEAGLARYTDLYDFAPVAYYTLTLDGTVAMVNMTGAQMLGVPRSVLRGRRLQLYEAPGSEGRVSGLLAELRRGSQSVTGELELVAAHGSMLIGHCVASLDAAAETCRIAVLDVTAQRRAEAALRVADGRIAEGQRLEALGRLAGGVAHDFNNMLMAINGAAEILEGSFATDDPRRADAQSIRESGEHAAALARQLLAFGRRTALRPSSVRLADVMRPIVPLLHRTLGEHISLIFNLDADVGLVTVDPVQFEQVVVNLALNARDAMPDGGTLTISLSPAIATEATAGEHPGVRPGNVARLSVSDTGTGIRADVLPHLFEPFFTTKQMGHGTGLGLATVEGIVAQSGGWVAVASEMGRGSTFSVFLPCAPSETETLREPTPLREIGGTETVLYVEDDTAVRLIGARMLRMLGYTVIDVAHPDLALGLPADTLDGVRLLVTDVIMPGMNGERLAVKLAAKRLDLPVLFVSGFAPDAVLLERLQKPATSFLAKPFTRVELGHAVRRAIDGT